MEKLEARPLIFDAEEIARAGAFQTLDRYGEFALYRGFVRPEHGPWADVDVYSGEQAADGQGAELSSTSSTDGVGHDTVITSAGQALGVNVLDDEDDGALSPDMSRCPQQRDRTLLWPFLFPNLTHKYETTELTA